jgi:hypothetical protein
MGDERVAGRGRRATSGEAMRRSGEADPEEKTAL